MQDPEAGARTWLRRSMFIYVLLLCADVLALSYIAPRATGLGFVSLSIVGLVGLLLLYQVVQHIRDLYAPLAESDGVILRKWKRADLVVAMQSHYITVDRAVFRLKPEDFVLVDEGMYVKVVHFPNTLNVVSVHEMRLPSREPPDET